MSEKRREGTKNCQLSYLFKKRGLAGQNKSGVESLYFDTASDGPSICLCMYKWNAEQREKLSGRK